MERYFNNMKGYPRIKVENKWIVAHRKVMEDFIGRNLLPYEVVHHNNGNKQDCRIENLTLLTQSTHTKLTNSQKAKKEVTCKEPECLNNSYTRGWCKSHYMKNRYKQKKEGTFVLLSKKAQYKSITVEGRKVPEHIYIMEQQLGRKIKKGYVVHHIDEDKRNNVVGNLMEMERSEHIRLHHSKRPEEKQTIEEKQQWSIQNRDKIKKYKKQYSQDKYQQDKHLILEQNKQWYEANKEKRKEYMKQYNLKKKNAK